VSDGKNCKKSDNNSKPALPWLEGSQNPAHFVKSGSVVRAFCNFVQQSIIGQSLISASLLVTLENGLAKQKQSVCVCVCVHFVCNK